MFWILTRDFYDGDWQDGWLLTAWREANPSEGTQEIMLTPYIRFEDSAELKEFLRLDGHLIVTSQPHMVNWLIANGLYEIGRGKENTR